MRRSRADVAQKPLKPRAFAATTTGQRTDVMASLVAEGNDTPGVHRLAAILQ